MKSQQMSLGVLLMATTALAVPAFAWAQDPAPIEDTAPVAQPDEAAPTEEAAPEPTETVVEVRGRHVPFTMRRTAEVSSIITADDLARTGDDNAAVVLTRVAGLSLVEGKFVYVRGLGERYSSAMLNGSPLPSPEPLQRVVPLDLFPASIIGRVTVQKTYSAEYPGEFGGGVVDLRTVAVPRAPFFAVGVGTGGNTETTFKKDLPIHWGSDTDFLGYDDGTRKMPSELKAAIDSGKRIGVANYTETELQAIGQSLTNAPLNLLQYSDSLPMNFSANMSGGTRVDALGGTLGFVGVADFGNSWSAREGIKQSGQISGDVLGVADDYDYALTANNVGLNALFSVGYQRDGHSLQWTNLFIRKTTKFTSITDGYAESENDTVRVDRTGWYERELFFTQLAGTHPLQDSLELNWAISDANTTRVAPYEKSIQYRFDSSLTSPGYGHYFSVPANHPNTTKFSYLDDTVRDANASLTWNFSLGEGRDGKLIGGFDLRDHTRDYETYNFQLTGTLPGGTPNPIYYERVDFLLSDVNIGPGKLHLEESVSDSQAYDASLSVNSAFIKTDIAVTPFIRLAGGLRYEEATQTIGLRKVFESTTVLPADTETDTDYLLPSATMTWNFAEDMQFRLGASKTIGRPQFRELAEPTYYDVDTNRIYIGNSNLVDTEIENFDARYEYYYGAGTYVTFGGFYKTLTNPVEQVFGKSDNTYTYVNAPSADLYGFEVDYKGMFESPFEGAFFDAKQWVLMANYTNTTSEVKFDGDEVILYGDVYNQNLTAAQVFKSGSKLQGQSDHLLNLQFGWEDSDVQSQGTLLLTYVSDRISARVSASEPDIIQEPGVQLDFVYRRTFEAMGREIGLSVEARNLTGTRYQEYQQQGGGKVYIDRYDQGSSLSVSLSTRF